MDVAHRLRRASIRLGIVALALPAVALAQGSPFLTGANSLQTNFYAIAGVLAIFVVIGLGLLAMVGRLSWAIAGSAIAGVVILFGAPQIVTWVRGMAGV